MHLFASSPFLRRAGTAAAVLALGTIAFAPAASASADKKATIDTYSNFTGNNIISAFGCPNSTVYGTTVTIPAKKHHITKASFPMNDGGATGSMQARGEIYAWDGSKATGTAIAETAPQTIDLQNADWNLISFKFKGKKVKPGQQYVIFASIDKEFEQCTNYAVAWGGADGSAYPDGFFVYQNNGGDESQWTGGAWSTIPSLAAAMLVYMGK